MKDKAREEHHKAVLEAVSMDPLDLEAEFKRIPALLAQYNEEYAVALRRWLRAKAEVDRTHARLYLEAREIAEEMGEKTTEGSLKATIESKQAYIDAVDARISSEAQKVRVGGILDALSAKKDALISIGAHMRAEMSGQPHLRNEGKGFRDVQDSKPGKDAKDSED